MDAATGAGMAEGRMPTTARCYVQTEPIAELTPALVEVLPPQIATAAE